VAASAAAGICSKVNSFAILPGVAMLSAISSMAGQNIGAGRYDRALATEREGLKLILPVAAVIFTCVNLFTRPILSAFSSDPEVLAIGERYLRFLSVDALIVTNVFCVNGLITGAGKTFVTLINTCVSSIVLRIPLAYVLAKGMGMKGVGIAVAASPLGSLLCGVYYVRSGRWKKVAIAR
jgi:Na+-driven multidrug efflux pump